MYFVTSHSGKMNLWPVEHFFPHFEVHTSNTTGDFLQNLHLSRDEFKLEFSGSNQAMKDPSHEGTKLCRARALQFSRENRSDNADNMYICQKIANFYSYKSNFQILCQYHDFNQFQGHFYECKTIGIFRYMI